MRRDYPSPRIAFQSHPARRCDYVVAVPAKDEAERLGSCLGAFGRQAAIDTARLGVVVALNNTTDRSLEVCVRLANEIACPVTVLDETLPPGRAHAGWARRLAMDAAYERCGSGGILLTTDADTIVDDDWVAQNLAALAEGVDAVAGFVTADPDELGRLDAAILDRGALEWEYQNLLAAYEAALDPKPWDPAPRHNQICGASLAVKREAYEAVGGIPPLTVGEDRALFEALAKRDYRIRHSLSAHVTASARTVGRAEGGMADALRLRHDPDYPCDDILESVDSATFRWRTRARLRSSWGEGWEITATASALQVMPELVEAARAERHFGAAWSKLQTASPSLAMDLVTSRTLAGELGRLRALVGEVIM